jgi:hypothetical protein
MKCDWEEGDQMNSRSIWFASLALVVHGENIPDNAHIHVYTHVHMLMCMYNGTTMPAPTRTLWTLAPAAGSSSLIGVGSLPLADAIVPFGLTPDTRDGKGGTRGTPEEKGTLGKRWVTASSGGTENRELLWRNTINPLTQQLTSPSSGQHL